MERADAINYFMDTLVGYSTQALIGIVMLGDDTLGKVLTNTDSSDIEYLKKVTAAALDQGKALEMAEREKKRLAAMTDADRDDAETQAMEAELGLDPTRDAE